METPVAARAPARNLIKPFPSFVAPTSVCVSRLYKNAVKQKCAQTPRACRPLTVACISTLSDYPVLSGSRNSQGPYREHAFSAGISLRQSSSTSSSFLGEEKEILTRKSYNSSTWSKSPLVPRAASRDVFGLRLPTITVKPEWWWRTLACVPYLIALQISDVGFYIQPFSERYKLFENLIFYVPGAITRLPSWFTMIYCFLAYIGIVKNKDWPHFFRFHLMMGMLLETSLQIVWYTCNFMPLIHYDGTFGMQFWAGMGFAYIIVLLACVKSALAGSYVQLPVITEAAFIHTLFNIGSFHRPF